MDPPTPPHMSAPTSPPSAKWPPRSPPPPGEAPAPSGSGLPGVKNAARVHQIAAFGGAAAAGAGGAAPLPSRVVEASERGMVGSPWGTGESLGRAPALQGRGAAC